VFAVVVGLPGTEFHKQIGFEGSLFGNGQGEIVEFGAGQCMMFLGDTLSCTNPFHPGILVRNDATKDRLQKRLESSLILSGLTFPHQPFI